MDRRLGRARPRPDLPGRARRRPTSGIAVHHGGLPRLGVRDRRHGRHRHARRDVVGGAELVARIRAVAPDLLVGVGLGVSNGDQAAEVARYADAVIVGSALVKTLLAAEDAGTPDDLTGLRAVVADLAAGVRR